MIDLYTILNVSIRIISLTVSHPSFLMIGFSDKLGTRKGMVIASLNINSLLPHVDEIEYLLKSRGIDFLALNETKIDDKLPDNLFKIDGYKFIRFDRTHHGGGVAVYCKESLQIAPNLRISPKSAKPSACVGAEGSARLQNLPNLFGSQSNLFGSQSNANSKSSKSTIFRTGTDQTRLQSPIVKRFAASYSFMHSLNVFQDVKLGPETKSAVLG